MGIALLREMEECGITAGNIFAMAAATAAYTDGDEWLDGLLRYLDGSRKLLREYTEAHLPRARLSPVEATYLGWLDLRAYGLSCDELRIRCAREGVAFTGGTFFGPEGEGHLRVNFGCPRSQLLAGMKRLCEALKEEE